MLVLTLFETDLGWAPSLDGRASFARMPLARKELEWFEQIRVQATKVRNVSRLGSHTSIPEARAI